MPILKDIFTKKPYYDLRDIVKPENVIFDFEFWNTKISDAYSQYWDEEFTGIEKVYFCISHLLKIIKEADRKENGKYYINDQQLNGIERDLNNIVEIIKEQSDIQGSNDIYAIFLKEDSLDDLDYYEGGSEYVILQTVISALLLTGQQNVLDVVYDFLKTIRSIEGWGKLKTCFFLEVADIFANAGDYYLFIEGRFVSAFSYYKITKEFNFDLNDEIVRSDSNEYSFPSSYTRIFEKLDYINISFTFWETVFDALYRKKAIRKQRGKGDTINRRPRIMSSECYGSICNFLEHHSMLFAKYGETDQYIAIQSRMWNDTQKLYHILTSKNQIKINNLRIELGVYYMILNETIIYGIRIARDNNIDIDLKKIVELYGEFDFALPLKIYQYDSTDDFIKKECGNNKESFESLVKISILVREILLLLAVDCPSELVYYTALSTLEYLLPVSSNKPSYCQEEMQKSGSFVRTAASVLSPSIQYKSMVGRYSIMNVGHMNDPQEGTILPSVLLGKKYDRDKTNGITSPYIFLKSFTTRKDDLPMWEMYGDRAGGCCIELDTDKIKEVGGYNLVRVCYLRETDNEPLTVHPEDNAELVALAPIITSKLRSLKIECNIYISSAGKNAIKTIEDLIKPIRYLFKSSSYSHENELRIIESSDYLDPRICFTKNRDGGKLYIPSKQRTYIKEIILGPKFKSVEDTIPYLQYRCKFLSDELGMKDINIRASSTHYI